MTEKSRFNLQEKEQTVIFSLFFKENSKFENNTKKLSC